MKQMLAGKLLVRGSLLHTNPALWGRPGVGQRQPDFGSSGGSCNFRISWMPSLEAPGGRNRGGKSAPFFGAWSLLSLQANPADSYQVPGERRLCSLP